MKKQTATALATMFLLLSASMALAAADVVGKVEGTIRGISKRSATVIYVEDAPGSVPPGARYVLDQKDKTFSPFVLPVPAGAEVAFVNSDPIMHNVHSYNGKDTIFNWGMAIQGITWPRSTSSGTTTSTASSTFFEHYHLPNGGARPARAVACAHPPQPPVHA